MRNEKNYIIAQDLLIQLYKNHNSIDLDEFLHKHMITESELRIVLDKMLLERNLVDVDTIELRSGTIPPSGLRLTPEGIEVVKEYLNEE
jgi:hypothetical protein